MIVTRYGLKIVLWILVTIIKEGLAVYSTPEVFYSRNCLNRNLEFCSFSQVNNYYNGTTFNCPANVAQNNIIRAGLALTEHGRYEWKITECTLTLTAPGATATNFAVTFQVRQPLNYWMKLGFFVVLIKTQTTEKYIDLIPFTYNSDLIINNNNNAERVSNKSLSLSTLTIFTSASGLSLVPFTSSFALIPPNGLFGLLNLMADVEYKLSASFSGDNVIVSARALPETKIKELMGIVIVYNPPQVAIAVANKFYMGFLNAPYSMGKNFSLYTVATAYGPNFNHKCIFGIQRYKHKTLIGASYYFSYSASNFENKAITQQEPIIFECYLIVFFLFLFSVSYRFDYIPNILMYKSYHPFEIDLLFL